MEYASKDKKTKFVFFITFLRAIAACLITNAHYTGIYPTDLLANGGLLGDILFFSVSGYCLCEIRTSFAKWYIKRLYRIYIPVIIITVLYVALGYYSISEKNIFWWMVYPTYYHFVASIVFLYIPFYFVCRFEIFKKRIPIIMATIFAVAVLYYLCFYDKSYYHIDTVREPFIRVLFFESMLLGAFFKSSNRQSGNKGKRVWVLIICSIISFCFYIGSKLLFSKNMLASRYQILNQIIIFAVLYFWFSTFLHLDSYFDKMPKIIKKAINFIASITLEIYLVQYVLIDIIKPHLDFPINWIVLTTVIITSAFCLHILCKYIYYLIDKFISFFKKKMEK